VLGYLYNGLFALRPHHDLVAGVASRVVSGKPVLDAGCGTGKLAEYVKNSRYLTGVDWSPTMLSRTRGRYGGGVISADIGHLPFTSGAFEQVVSINVLYAVADPARALAELARVLRPGGQLLLATPVSSALWPLLREHFRVASAWDNLRLLYNGPRLLAWLLVLTVRGVMSDSTFTFLSEERLRQLVVEAGFTILSCEPCYAGIDRLVLAVRKESHES